MRHYSAFFCCSIALVTLAAPAAQLTQAEQDEISSRLINFYQHPDDPSLMNIRQPKVDPNTGKPARRATPLHADPTAAPFTLEWLAGEKGTDAYQNAYCHQVLRRRFPGLNCDQPVWAAIRSNDRVEDLTPTWVDDPSYDLDDIPTEGKTDIDLWSDDYWATQFGLTSFRYGTYDADHPFKNYHQAVAAYSQPDDWNDLLSETAAKIPTTIWDWSPSEKYDLLVGDEAFTLTNAQKQEGKDYVGKNGDVEAWMGICDGWTAASIMVPKPVKAITLTGARGYDVKLAPADVRALATLTWANDTYESNSIGGRCNAKHPKAYPNGRLKDQNCFDTNPATFHLALGNMIGRAHGSFIMDKAFDYEVWNQPIQSYELIYFNPMHPRARSKNWHDVAIPYDDAFKRRDRFQHPLTRGVHSARGYNDRRIKEIVGVIATVTYMDEISPTHSTKPDDDDSERETYTYDLELVSRQGGLYPEGGEWHENAHPDFLWVPQQTDYAHSTYDDESPGYTGRATPSSSLTSYAQEPSESAMPLCEVIKVLVNRSSGKRGYHCPAG